MISQGDYLFNICKILQIDLSLFLIKSNDSKFKLHLVDSVNI